MGKSGMETFTIEIVRKKSEMNAEGSLAYKRLELERRQFLPCRMEEQKEEYKICYDTTGFRAFPEIRRERRIDILLVLLGIAGLYELSEEYRFSLRPENVFFDRHRNAAVMERDLYARGEEGENEWFLPEYKALIGYALQKKYSYEDYLEGGNALAIKTRILKPISQMESVEKIVEYLEMEYEKLAEDERENRTMVKKGWLKVNRIYRAVSLILLFGLSVGMVYRQTVEKPREQALLAASDAFVRNDYLKVMDELADLRLDRIPEMQQYMLASAYVKSENLTMEQKENILGTLTPGGEKKRIHYWICLGRMDVSEAQNLAMQQSDDELLLYAYLKEKNLLEKDQEISGEEKTARLADLQSRIDKLSEKYKTGE